jgi:DnaJ-class molecular chaperone
MRRDSVPEKYGMVICPLCDGKGFLVKSSGLSDDFSRSVCAKCGGFGALIKEEEVLRNMKDQDKRGKRNRLGREEMF